MQTFVIAWYEIDRAYGGPEEGGWWYDCGTLVRTFKVVKGSEDKAFAVARRANRLMDHLQRHMREVGSMAYSGGRYAALVHEKTAPEHFPQKRPYFE